MIFLSHFAAISRTILGKIRGPFCTQLWRQFSGQFWGQFQGQFQGRFWGQFVRLFFLTFLYFFFTACQCNNQAKECNHKTGRCHCTTKGIIGEKCDRCDIVNHYYGDPVKNSCYCKYMYPIKAVSTIYDLSIGSIQTEYIHKTKS